MDTKQEPIHPADRVRVSAKYTERLAVKLAEGGIRCTIEGFYVIRLHPVPDRSSDAALLDALRLALEYHSSLGSDRGCVKAGRNKIGRSDKGGLRVEYFIYFKAFS